MDEDTIVEPFRSEAEGSIQPGSIVLGSDGGELGSVVSVSPDAITVKRKRLLGGTVSIPRSLVRDTQERHVELAVPRQGRGARPTGRVILRG